MIRYKQILQNIIENGEERRTRAGDTYSLFGVGFHHNLTDSFPILTIKKVAITVAAKELASFIQGKTDLKSLGPIWQADIERAFGKGATEAGPIYGSQWRNFNGDNIDQLKNVVETIRTNPTDRRLIVTSWNPSKEHEMCLPPCIVSFQFYCSGSNHLDLLVHQRSADFALGFPFDMVEYAMLQMIVAKDVGRIARHIHFIIGDAHVYKAHLPGARQMLLKRPKNAPTLDILSNKLDDFTEFSFKLNNYESHGKVKFPLLVGDAK